jgi:hypothetical protein
MKLFRSPTAPVSYRIVAVKRARSSVRGSIAAVCLALLHFAFGVILAMAPFSPPEELRLSDEEPAEEIFVLPEEYDDNEVLLIEC